MLCTSLALALYLELAILSLIRFFYRDKQRLCGLLEVRFRVGRLAILGSLRLIFFNDSIGRVVLINLVNVYSRFVRLLLFIRIFLLICIARNILRGYVFYFYLTR
jgi:hypothetical protein